MKQGTKEVCCTIFIYSSDIASDKARSEFIPGATPKMSCIWSTEFVTYRVKEGIYVTVVLPVTD